MLLPGWAQARELARTETKLKIGTDRSHLLTSYRTMNFEVFMVTSVTRGRAHILVERVNQGR